MQEKKTKRFFFFLQNKYLYIKTKNIHFSILMLVFNTTIQSMPKDERKPEMNGHLAHLMR